MVQTITAQEIKRAISFYYLLSYCPADKLEEFLKETAQMRAQIPEGVEAEVASRIVTFHTASRLPDKTLIEKLFSSLQKATNGEEDLRAFQALMEEVFSLPGRAKADNRLHRKKGCRFCEAPCAYGYFSLVSEPRFELLMQLLAEEKQKAPEEKSAVRAAWSYSVSHIAAVTGAPKGYISSRHLGNLAYCLLMLSMAKSRYPLPEEQIKTFQARNQRLITAMTRENQ
jgi:hypothetical protein